MNPGNAFARRGAIGGAVAGGLGLGAIGAGLGSLSGHNENGTKRTKNQRIGGAIGGGIALGTMGALHGHSMGWNHRAHKWNSGFRPDAPKPKIPDWLKGAKTKAEGRRAYHAQARKAHPDLGGSHDAIKNLNNEWDAHEKMFKEAMLLAFADELEKIAAAKTAMLGAMLGGTAGWAMSPNTIKGKVLGTAAGAAVGTAAGALAGGAKRAVWDEQRERDQRAMAGY